MTKRLLKGKPVFSSPTYIVSGDYIEFTYNGESRTGVVVTPNWKDNVDLYITDDDEQLMQIQSHIDRNRVMDGSLWENFGDAFDFRSFKIEKIGGLQRIPLKLVEVTDSEDNNESES